MGTKGNRREETKIVEKAEGKLSSLKLKKVKRSINQELPSFYWSRHVSFLCSE